MRSALLVFVACVALGCEETEERPPPAYPVAPPTTVTAAEVPQPSATPAEPATLPDTDPSAIQEFRPALQPYGTWADDPSYGTVWYPSEAAVGADFQPYVTNGHWVYDDTDGWVWVSDYAWGWAPFHYGRWVWIAPRGWAWVPGRRYAGAWVNWRVGDGYVGWGPMPPSYVWRNGVAVGVGVPVATPFVFVPSREVFAPGVARHVVGGGRVPVIANHTRPYVPGTPTVAGRAPAQPSVAGPSPLILGIAKPDVARPTVIDPGVARARTFATPSVAPRYAPAPNVAPRPAPAPNVVPRPQAAPYHPPVLSPRQPAPNLAPRRPAPNTVPRVQMPPPR
jgi:hypothetical protein